MKFILSLILLFVGIFFTQPAFAVDIPVEEALKLPNVSVITASDVKFELKLEVNTILMVACANTLSHPKANILNIPYDTLTGKRLMPLANFMEVETVPKFPYLIHLMKIS